MDIKEEVKKLESYRGKDLKEALKTRRRNAYSRGILMGIMIGMALGTTLLLMAMETKLMLLGLN